MAQAVRQGPDQIAASFLEWYSQNQSDNQVAAAALEEYLGQVLADNNVRPLVVSARAKSIESVRGKLLLKAYKRPHTQLTDRLGARVILYHAREVDGVAALLRTKVRVKEADSSDKRLALGLREFGYRSYHIVGALPTSVTAAPSLWSLRGRTFEIQIRSLLEHVWAEIEHDVVYKSGAEWPAAIKRRFASLAGVLELLEHEFGQLEVISADLVAEARTTLLDRMDLRRSLDVPSMCALLEIERPNGLSFRGAVEAGKPFPPGIERLLHLALRRSRMLTVGALRRGLRSLRMQRCLRRYATTEGIPYDEVSHLAVLALLIAVRTPTAFRVFFPELYSDHSMQEALRVRRLGKSGTRAAQHRHAAGGATRRG